LQSYIYINFSSWRVIPLLLKEKKRIFCPPVCVFHSLGKKKLTTTKLFFLRLFVMGGTISFDSTYYTNSENYKYIFCRVCFCNIALKCVMGRSHAQYCENYILYCIVLDMSPLSNSRVEVCNAKWHILIILYNLVNGWK